MEISKIDQRDGIENIVKFAIEKKPLSIKVLNVGKQTLLTDYFIIIMGSTNIHLRAIADNIKEKTKKYGSNVWHVEGYENGKWILLDYVDIVVHIFDENTYYYYDIESLWGDVPKETIELED